MKRGLPVAALFIDRPRPGLQAVCRSNLTVGDRIGRKAVIWVSCLGVAPFALALPYANLFWTAVLASVIGLMFGIGGVGAAGLGQLADGYGIVRVYGLTSFLPLLGLATAFLPNIRKKMQNL